MDNGQLPAQGTRKPLVRAIALTFLLFLPTFFTMGIIDQIFNPEKDAKTVILFLVWTSFLVLYFRMVYSGKTDKIRTILFFSLACAFVVEFVLNLYELRGHFMTVTFENVINGEVPFCHIVIPQTILSILFKKEVVFPGMMESNGAFHYPIAPMIIIWLGVSLLVGRGWCSWFCFYGGWEDGISTLRKKARIRNLDPRLIRIPFIVLIVVAVLSFVFITPVYCTFLCPFKAVSEFFEVSSPFIVVQTVLFASLFVGLVVVLPFLTKKRTQCSFLCPFGAFQSLVDRINPYNVRIDTSRCTGCGVCMRVCPMMSIDKKSYETGKVKLSCVKCGRCVDACPNGAIVFHIKGTPVTSRWSEVAKEAYRYSGFLVYTLIASSFINGTLYRFYHLVTEGSLLVG